MALRLYAQKNPTPNQLSFYTALVLSLLSLVVILLCKWLFLHDLKLLYVVLLMPMHLIVGFFIFRFSLKHFIYRKVKLIYKSIHRLKAAKREAPMNVDMHNHIMDQVEKEVIEWAKEWNKEIHYLKRLEEYRREFIDNVSHELKTPIFNMQGYLYTLLDEDIEEQELRNRYMQRAVDNLERIAAIVEDLNKIARFEAGKIVLEVQHFDIVDLVCDVFEDMELNAKQKQVRLEFKDTISKPILVRADKGMIRRVLINLVSNAIKYGREGGKILVSFYDLDRNRLIEISDNGPGIEQEHIPRLFERFYRIDKGRSRENGGTGLGLAIVKHIIEAHKQTIHVRSRVGTGSTFGFTLEKA